MYARLCTAASARGLGCRGGFAVEAGDTLPEVGNEPTRTVVLLGFTGAKHWSVVRASVEFSDGRPHPLDRWSVRMLTGLGAEFDARPLFPFGGPPWWPFQRWAQRAEVLHASPLGILVHPEFGLWHAYRGALLFATEFRLPTPVRWPSPCASCAAKPCIGGCPAGAVTARGFDRGACATHVASPQGIACRSGCLARASCPVGASHRYGPEQSAFHMQQLTAT
ncbi:MAG: hypothetical protein JSS29_06540 [Proteobacteria bacterium]|nr:hypothetical protein [Pseudomonadota bacterium]